jgi:hypothetical protein
VLRTLLRRLVSAPGGINTFREHYDGDGLPPVSADERQRMKAFGRCIACGLCDRGEAARIQRSGGAYRGIMPLVLAGSRSMPDFRAAAYSFSFVSEQVLQDKELVCPTGVPLVDVARFVAEKAKLVGGPLPLPTTVQSLPPRP